VWRCGCVEVCGGVEVWRCEVWRCVMWRCEGVEVVSYVVENRLVYASLSSLSYIVTVDMPFTSAQCTHLVVYLENAVQEL
jgi:hypothetical protein